MQGSVWWSRAGGFDRDCVAEGDSLAAKARDLGRDLWWGEDSASLVIDPVDILVVAADTAGLELASLDEPRPDLRLLSHPDLDARAAGQVVLAVSWIGDGNTVYARLGERVHVLKRLSWTRMIFVRVVEPDSETRKKAGATIVTLPARQPITLPATSRNLPCA